MFFTFLTAHTISRSKDWNHIIQSVSMAVYSQGGFIRRSPSGIYSWTL